MNTAEEFVCKLYKVNPSIKSSDKARSAMFAKTNGPEDLTPSSDLLRFHIKRAQYQALIWNQAHITKLDLPNPEDYGWRLKEKTLVPVLMGKVPVPKEYIEFVSCQCQKACKTMQDNAVHVQEKQAKMYCSM